MVLVGKRYFGKYHGKYDTCTNGRFLWGIPMVEFVKISENGTLLQIKEVSDTYRDRLYRWDEDD